MMPWTILTSCRLQELCDCEGIQFRLPGFCFIIISREEEQKFLNSGIYIVGTKKSCFMGFGLWRHSLKSLVLFLLCWLKS